MTGPARRKTYDTTTDPSRGRIRREVASALGLLVILFNLVAGILVSSSAEAANAPFLDEIFGDRIVICTGSGMIVLDAQGNPVSDGSVDPMCVFCLPLAQGSADTPVVLPVLEAPVAFEPETWVVETLVAPKLVRLVASASPRGPPLV